MYSNSTSFMGGGNSGRPGPPQYVQASYLSPQQAQQPQQQNVLSQQPTGFGSGQIQSQYTGYPGQGPQQAPQGQQLQQLQQLQPQYTRFPQQVPPSQGNVLPQQQFQTSQQASQPAIQPSHPPIATQQTSSQIAQSFQSIPAPNPTPTTGAKIPKIRLSFLTVQDQAKFEQLFKSAVGEGQSLDGNKVKELLIRSKLSGSDLMKIWVLSDTTKSGQLLFPEFALAMYLCNLRIGGKDLPQTLPERIANEVSSMVDIISFGVADDRPQSAPRSNAPKFDSPSTTPSIQQPQPQASNSQLLSQLTSQPTGFAAQYIPPQPTGFPNQLGVIGPQPAALGQQQSIYQQNPQATGYSGPLPPMPPIASSYVANLSPAQTGGQPGGQVFPLNAQPTGVPGQWGLVNTPPSGLPNIEALQQRMMPQPGREGGYTTAGLAGSAKVPWAVTKDEKKIYDQLFKAWDGLNKGFIGGDVAIEVMGQSGLPKSDLEKIWTLSDPGNKGKLDMDEFAVAMHLIYRKLNSYPVPNQLPPELVPPSTRNFADSIGTVKSLLSQDAETRKNSSGFLQPQQTGVSYLKNRSFRTDPSGTAAGRKDATVFRNNDDDVGYRSSARRRVGDGGRTPSPLQSTSDSSEKYDGDLSVEQLRKNIREKQMLLDAMDVEAENDADKEDGKIDRSDRPEDLYRRIQQIQDDLDNLPRASPQTGDTEAGRRTLRREVQRLADRVPELESNIRKTDQNISDAKLELSRFKDANERASNRSERKTGLSDFPRSAVASSSAGTYSSYKTGEDRASYIKQQAEQRMAERLAALGLKPPTILGESSQQRHEREVRERQERRERALQAEADDDKREQERQIRLAAERPTPPPGGSMLAKKPPPPPSRKGRSDSSGQRAEARRKADEAAAQLEIKRKVDHASAEAEAKRRAEADVRRKAEREAERKAELEAEERARELEVTSRKQAQEAKVKKIADESRRQEEELAKERESAQARLNALEEQVRKGKVKKLEEKRRKQAVEKEAREREERVIKLAAQKAELQAAREREIQLKLQLESLDDDDSSDEDGPQDITPQGTTPTNSQILSRDLEPRPIQSLTPSTHESTEAPAASNAPVPSPPNQIQNNESKNPFFKKLNQNADSAPTPTAQPSSSIASPSTQEPSTNPFHRMAQQESGPRSPVHAQSEPPYQVHFPPLSSTPSSRQRPSRVRPEEDEWSVVDSNENSSDDESDRPSGGTAKHLASILFGTMGPPRPLSAMDEKDKPKTPLNDSPATPTAGPSINSDSAPAPPPLPTGSGFGGAPDGAPPPPPMPITGAPPPPPMPNVGVPPPPPMPHLGAPPPPPLPGANSSADAPHPHPIVVGFLGDIVRGKDLRKVETKDRSQASVAGRVLD